MADGNRHRIGSVIAELDICPQRQAHHFLNLLLIGSPVSCHNRFYLGRRIRINLNAPSQTSGNRNASRNPQMEGAAGILGVEDVFHRDFVGFETIQEPIQFGVNKVQPRIKIVADRRVDDVGQHQLQRTALFFNTPDTEMAGTGIDAEDSR